MASDNNKGLSDNPLVVVIGVIAAIATIVTGCIAIFIFTTGVQYLTDLLNPQAEPTSTPVDRVIDQPTPIHPAVTSTRTPTKTPRPTAAPTPTIDTDPSLYDNFNNPDFDASFSQRQWDYSDDPPDQAFQQGGILVVTQDRTSGAGDLIARKYDYVTLEGFTSDPRTFYEARLKLNPGSQGNVHLKIDAHLPTGETFFFECGIYEDGQAKCIHMAWPLKEGYGYETEGKRISYGTWHTVRIEMNSTTMTFSYFIDNRMVSSHTPAIAASLNNARFTLKIGVYGEAVTGYIDDVRIGPVGESEVRE